MGVQTRPGIATLPNPRGFHKEIIKQHPLRMGVLGLRVVWLMGQFGRMCNPVLCGCDNEQTAHRMSWCPMTTREHVAIPFAPLKYHLALYVWTCSSPLALSRLLYGFSLQCTAALQRSSMFHKPIRHSVQALTPVLPVPNHKLQLSSESIIAEGASFSIIMDAEAPLLQYFFTTSLSETSQTTNSSPFRTLPSTGDSSFVARAPQNIYSYQKSSGTILQSFCRIWLPNKIHMIFDT